MDTDDTDIDNLEEALMSFIETEGVSLLRKRLAAKFREEAPSKSGKSKKAILDTEEGFELPLSLVYVDRGRTQSGTPTEGTGFVKDLIDDHTSTILAEIIEEWLETQSIVDTVITD